MTGSTSKVVDNWKLQLLIWHTMSVMHNINTYKRGTAFLFVKIDINPRGCVDYLRPHTRVIAEQHSILYKLVFHSYRFVALPLEFFFDLGSLRSNMLIWEHIMESITINPIIADINKTRTPNAKSSSWTLSHWYSRLNPRRVGWVGSILGASAVSFFKCKICIEQVSWHQ